MQRERETVVIGDSVADFRLSGTNSTVVANSTVTER